MTVKLAIELRPSPNGGTDITFKASPSGKVSEHEVELANTIVCMCDLLNNDEFLSAIDPWIANELVKLQSDDDYIPDDKFGNFVKRFVH